MKYGTDFKGTASYAPSWSKLLGLRCIRKEPV